MLSMQTGAVLMIQKICQALFGLHNRSSSPEVARDFACARKGKGIHHVTLEQDWFLAPYFMD